MTQQYDMVTILNVPKVDEAAFLQWNKRLPKAGDVGVVIEIYRTPQLGYEIECCEPGNPKTQWMHTFSADELRAAQGLPPACKGIAP